MPAAGMLLQAPKRGRWCDTERSRTPAEKEGYPWSSPEAGGSPELNADNKPRDRVLVVDDDHVNRTLLTHLLSKQGHEVLAVNGGPEALDVLANQSIDIVLLDVRMPGMDGYEVCRRIRADSTTAMLPVVMVTAEGPDQKLAALDAGADDFVPKPLDHAELCARVRSLLRIKRYHDTVAAQSAELATQAAELAEWNASLERRVAEQVAELEGLSRLRRFLSAPVADLVVGSGGERLLDAHRGYIAAVFADLRGFTVFSETSEPEELMRVLGEFHEAVGEVLRGAGATVGFLAGDGVMFYFNDPLPAAEPEIRAVGTAVAIREAMEAPVARWHRLGLDLGLGLGLAAGYATLGMVGFEGRFDYTAMGTVVNTAARLCAQAQAGQVLVDPYVLEAVGDRVVVEPMGEILLKGLHRPLPVHNVVSVAEGVTIDWTTEETDVGARPRR